jgi:hypothetical protein
MGGIQYSTGTEKYIQSFLRETSCERLGFLGIHAVIILQNFLEKQDMRIW